MDILTQTGSSWKVYPDLTGTSKNLGGLNVSKKVYSAWRTSLYYFFFILKHSDHRNFDFDFHVFRIVTLIDTTDALRQLQNWNPDFSELSLGAL